MSDNDVISDGITNSHEIPVQVMTSSAVSESSEPIRTPEASFHHFFYNMVLGFALHEIICDDDGKPIDYRFLEVNPAFLQITGLGQEIVGKTVREVLPDIEQYWIDTYGNVALNGETIQLENYSQQLGKWFSIQAFQTEPSRFGVVFHDITNRKRSETLSQVHVRLSEYAATHSAEALMQRMLDEVEAATSSQVGFLHFFDADQQTLSLQTWSTNTLNHMCSIGERDHHYPLEEAGVWADAIRQRAPVIHNDYASLPDRKALPEGHAPVIRELVVPIIRNDLMVAILGVGNKPSDYNETDLEIANKLANAGWDTIMRKRAEEALLRSERALTKAQHVAHVGSWVWDIKNNSLTWSDEMYIIFGISKDTFSGYLPDVIAAAIHPEDRAKVEASNNSVATEKNPIPVEYRIIHPDGTIRTVWGEAGELILDENGQPTLLTGIVMDITHRKELEQQAKMAEVLAVELEKEKELTAVKSRILDTISHEFRTPLAILQTSSELLTRYFDRLKSDRREQILANLKDQVANLTEMIDDVVELSRVQDRSETFRPKPVDLGIFSQSIFDSMRFTDKAVHQFEMIDDAPDHPVMADAVLLKHIMTNLLENAVKYSPDGGKVTLALGHQDSEIFIKVSDEGIGIPGGDQSRLFESFYRASNVDTVRGSGLGLSIVKEYVDLHGGHIEFESEIGKGTTFTVTLPMMQEERPISDEFAMIPNT